MPGRRFRIYSREFKESAVRRVRVGQHREPSGPGRAPPSPEWSGPGALESPFPRVSPPRRGQVRVARALPGLPHLARALAHAELSYAKVRASPATGVCPGELSSVDFS